MIRTLFLIGLGVVIGYGMGWFSFSQPSEGNEQAALSPSALHEATLAALDDPDFAQRTVLLVGLLDRVTDENAEAMFDALDERVANTREEDARLIVRELARRDPQFAFDRVMQWPTSKLPRGVQVVAFEWAQTDPLAARAATDQVVHRKAREGVLRGLVYGWSHGGHSGLTEYLINLEEGGPKQEFVAILAADLNRKSGSAAAFEWMELQLEAGDLQWSTLVFDRGLNAVAAKNPKAAAEFLSRHIDEAYTQNSPKAIAAPWLLMNPEAATRWLQTLPDDERLFEASRWAYKRWSILYPEEARVWFTSAEPGAYLDGALGHEIDSLQKANPAQALQLSKRITNPESRRTVRINTLASWLRSNSEAAEAWMETFSVPEKNREVARALGAKPRSFRSIRDQLGEGASAAGESGEF